MMLAFCLVNLVLFQPLLPQLPLPPQHSLLLPQQQQPQDQQLDIGGQLLNHV